MVGGRLFKDIRLLMIILYWQVQKEIAKINDKFR